jgi:hypothetical protein
MLSQKDLKTFDILKRASGSGLTHPAWSRLLAFVDPFPFVWSLYADRICAKPPNKSHHVLYLSDGLTKIGVEFDARHVSVFAKKNACKYPEGLIGRTVALIGACHLVSRL